MRIKVTSCIWSKNSANVAQIYFEAEGDGYRATNREGKIDLVATVNRLNQAMEFMRYICDNIQSD